MMMLGDAMSTGGAAIRELRSSTTAARESVAVPRDAGHASLGRLLRLVADPRSDESHVEAAIKNHEANAAGVAPMEVTAAAPPRALALSDHRHISNIGSVLDAVDRAMAALDATSPNGAPAARNMLQALATALATQSVSECSSTKHNMCVWTASSKKRLRLLEWMTTRRDPVVEDALRTELTGDKTSQLTASLVILELAQRHRRRQSGVRGRWSVLLDPLVIAVRNGSVETPTGAKPSKLGTAALDALIAVLCLASESSEREEQVMECMRFALSTFVQWHARSARRQWAVMAARQLASMMTEAMCKDIGTRQALEMAAWHWNATAMWLCSRSDCVLSVRKTLVDAVARTVDVLYRDTCSHHEEHPGGHGISQHKTMASLRRMCALMSAHVGRSAEVLPTVAVKGKLLVALAASVAAPTSRELALEMLRKMLIGDSASDNQKPEPVLSLSQPEVKAFVSMVQRSFTSSNALDGGVASLIAQLCLRAGLTIHEDHSNSDTTAVRFWLIITDRALDVYTAIPSFDQATRTQWLKDTSRAVLGVLHHHCDKDVRTHAAKLVPKLDLALCMQYTASRLPELDAATSGALIAWIFQCAEGNAALTQDLSSVLVDSLCRGTSTTRSASGPSDFGVTPPQEQVASEDLQAALLVQSREGWCARATSTTRTSVLAALIRKVFGSPRDSTLVAWLRELSLLGWFDDALASILPIVTDHMKDLESLTEELLEDDSTNASRAIEHLLFARLAPNLVLRVVRRTSFLSLFAVSPSKLLTKANDKQSAVRTCLSELAHALWSQVLDPLEYKEVKMLSIELLTNLPVQEILPIVLASLTGFVARQGAPVALVKLLAATDDEELDAVDGGFVVAKLLVYYLNLLFTDESIAVLDITLLDKTVSVLLTVLSLPCSPNEAFSAEKSPLVDLQMGAIECISLLVARCLKQVAPELRFVEDAIVEIVLTGLDANSPHQLAPIEKYHVDHETQLQRWRTIAHGASVDHGRFSETQLRICCCNVLLSSFAKTGSDSTGTFQNRVLQQRILPSIQLTLPPPVLAGCLQIAFSFFFKVGAAIERDDEPAADIAHAGVAIVVRILETPQVLEPAVYMNALKLLGALIGKVSWLWPSLAADGATTQQTIATGLQRLRDASATLPVQQLAQSLLGAILSA